MRLSDLHHTEEKGGTVLVVLRKKSYRFNLMNWKRWQRDSHRTVALVKGAMCLFIRNKLVERAPELVENAQTWHLPSSSRLVSFTGTDWISRRIQSKKGYDLKDFRGARVTR